eukprot:COSAG01_NODE_2135_length_8343_cov_24.694081_2_plen_70_part_00
MTLFSLILPEALSCSPLGVKQQQAAAGSPGLSSECRQRHSLNPLNADAAEREAAAAKLSVWQSAEAQKN